MSFKEDAIQRAIKVLDGHAYDRVADLLADLLHYCDSQQGVDRGTETFEEELDVAYGYVDEELGIDAELADDRDDKDHQKDTR